MEQETVSSSKTQDDNASTSPMNQQINSLKNFQQHSRLHFIGQWKTKMKEYMRECFKEHPEWNHGRLSEQRSFIHMDLDAFFCSVQLAKPQYAHLKEKPVVVAAGHGNSDISSCNYVARKFGIHAGMYVNAARERCPDIVTIGYDFEACERVVKTLYEIIFSKFPSSYRMAMEVYSVDDVMIATNTDALEELRRFCDEVREAIKHATGCTVSCGVATNMLLSRLVTSLAKPDGVYVLEKERIKSFIARTPFNSIHGVGDSTLEKVRAGLIQHRLLRSAQNTSLKQRMDKKGNIKVDDILCEDVQRLSKETLQQMLGSKAGENFFRLCRGDDDRLVVRTGDTEEEEAAVRKNKKVSSVGCSMNYAVRPTCEEDVWKIIREVLQDVCKKLTLHTLAAGGVRVTVLERHPLHPKTTQKFLGRGKCVEVVFPIAFPRPFEAPDEEEMMDLIKAAIQPLLVRSRPQSPTSDLERAKQLGVENTGDSTVWTVTLSLVPDLLIEDIRGISIQATKLIAKTSASESFKKRVREETNSVSARSRSQRTLDEVLTKQRAPAAPHCEEEEVVEIISTQTQRRRRAEETNKSTMPPTRSPSSTTPSSPRRPRVSFFVPEEEEEEEKDDTSVEFSHLLSMKWSDDFLTAWKKVCASACTAKDYFMVRACLRCAALKLLSPTCFDSSSSSQWPPTDLNERKAKLKDLEAFAMNRLPLILDYL